MRVTERIERRRKRRRAEASKRGERDQDAQHGLPVAGRFTLPRRSSAAALRAWRFRA
jgi:hypothetical protein